MAMKHLLFALTIIKLVNSENVGWKSYLAENPTEFHNLKLEWESGDETLVPSWLSGIFVRNGPAQVRFTANKSKAQIVNPSFHSILLGQKRN